MLKTLLVAASLALIGNCALADGIVNGGSGGGGGSGTVTSIATSCGLTGGTITTTGTIKASETPEVQSGANYAFQDADCGKLKILSNASNQVPTIAQAGAAGSFANGWVADVCNDNTGTQTITPTTSTIGGAATYLLGAGTAAAMTCIQLVSDGTNYRVVPYSRASANPSATASDTAVNGSAATFMRSDAAPAVQKGTNAQFGLAEGDGTSISMSAGVVSRSALTGDVTASAGSSATTLAAGNAGNLNSGTLLAARMPALTGDCTTSAGAVATTCWRPMQYKSGNWYSSYGSGAPIAGNTYVASTVYCSPFIVAPPGFTMSTLGVNVTTTSNGNNISIALYNSTNGRPSTKVDSIGNTGITLGAGTGAYTAAVANGTDVLAPGFYWACTSADNAVVAFAAVSTATSAAGASQLVGSTTLVNVVSTSSGAIGYVTCTAGTTCQGASFAWSGTTFAWPADLSSSTWADGGSSRSAMVAIKVN